MDVFHRNEAKTLNAQLTQHVRADQNAGDKVSGDRRQLSQLGHAGEHQTHKKGDGESK